MTVKGTGRSGCLLDGAAYKQSLRDGRAVWMGGARVEDVTREPALGAGIDLMAEMFDAARDQRPWNARFHSSVCLRPRTRLKPSNQRSGRWSGPRSRSLVLRPLSAPPGCGRGGC